MTSVFRKAVLFSVFLLWSAATGVVNGINNIPVQPQQVTTVTNYLTRVSYSETFTLRTPSLQYGCIYRSSGPYTASSGDNVTIEFVSNAPINFYIMEDTSFKTWVSGTASCTVTGYLLGKRDVSSFRHNWIVPQHGKYILLFINHSHQNSPVIKLKLIGKSQNVLATATITSSLVEISSPGMSTATVGSEETIVPYLLVGIILAVVVGLLAFLKLKRRQQAHSLT